MQTKTRVGGCLLVVVAWFAWGTLHAAEGTLPVHELKQRFYRALHPEEIIKVLRTLDRQKDLTDAEKGARYRWGQTPVDRNPPPELGDWWRGLSPAEKDEYRVRWFRTNAMVLNLERVALILELRARLLNIQQDIREARNEKTVNLAPVPIASGEQTDTAPRTSRSGEANRSAGSVRESSSANSTNGDTVGSRPVVAADSEPGGSLPVHPEPIPDQGVSTK